MAIEAEGGAHGYIVTDPERLAELAQAAIAERQRRMSGAYGGGRMIGWNDEGYRWADAHAQETGLVDLVPEDRYATRVLPASILYEGIEGDYPHEAEYLAMRSAGFSERSDEGVYITPSGGRFWREELFGSYEAPPPDVATYETHILPVVEAKKTRREHVRHFFASEGEAWKAEFHLWKYYIGRVRNLFNKSEHAMAASEEAPTYRFDGDNNLVPLVTDE